MDGDERPVADQRQRIDKWLFFTRMAKSRSVAQALLKAGQVRVNGVPATQASQLVKPGDVLTLRLERGDRILRVKAPGARRGPYEEARGLYDDETPPEDVTKRLTRLEQAVRAPGSGRPVKKERRQIDRLFPGPDEDF